MMQVLGFDKFSSNMDIAKLRILFVHSGSDLYGASRSLLRLSSRLVQDGAVLQVIVPHEGPLVPALQAKGITVFIQRTLPVIQRQKIGSLSGKFQLLTDMVFSTISLLGLVRQFKPDLIHTMTAVILSPGMAAKLSGIPHIWHVREFFGEFGNLWRYYQRYMLWLSTKIVCVSTPIAEQFKQKNNSEKICTIHNGFPAEEFSDVSAERVECFKSKYGLSDAKHLIGVVGRIKFQRKGQEVFVRAAHLLRDRFPDARFLCIGSPFPGNESHLVDLLNLIRELGLDDYVLYTGDAEDIKAAIAGLDILVLPSAQPEPFGGVVIEAMALARPVVATAIGGSIEQVIDGQTGYLVQPGDPHSMAAAIEKLLESPERRVAFGRNGFLRFLEKFEFEPFYQKMLAVYEQIVKAEYPSV